MGELRTAVLVENACGASEPQIFSASRIALDDDTAGYRPRLFTDGTDIIWNVPIGPDIYWIKNDTEQRRNRTCIMQYT